MIGVQAEGCAPIARAFEEGRDEVREWTTRSKTVASAIADPLIGYEDDGTYTLQVIRQSRGIALRVFDDEILRAAIDLSGTEGLFAEPTGATSIAAVRELLGAVRLTRVILWCVL